MKEQSVRSFSRLLGAVVGRDRQRLRPPVATGAGGAVASISAEATGWPVFRSPEPGRTRHRRRAVARGCATPASRNRSAADRRRWTRADHPANRPRDHDRPPRGPAPAAFTSEILRERRRAAVSMKRCAAVWLSVCCTVRLGVRARRATERCASSGYCNRRSSVAQRRICHRTAAVQPVHRVPTRENSLVAFPQDRNASYLRGRQAQPLAPGTARSRTDLAGAWIHATGAAAPVRSTKGPIAEATSRSSRPHGRDRHHERAQGRVGASVTCAIT